MRLPVALLFMACFLALAAPAQAADPTSALIDARMNLTQGKHAEAISRIREALVAIYQEAPLACQNVTWIAEAPTGYGRYKPRSSNVFPGVEPLILYLEPIGYSIVPAGGGYRFGLRADFLVFNDKNEPLGGAQDFARSQVETRSPLTEDFGLIGIPTPSLMAFTILPTRGMSCPTELPRGVPICDVAWGQARLSSSISAPACSNSFASLTH